MHTINDLNTQVYLPLSLRLCLGPLPWELEDFYFRYMYPDAYQCIAHLLDEPRSNREQYINNVVMLLRNTMYDKGFSVDISGRPKHIYSIWRKMQQKDLTFHQLFDLYAVRIVVESVPDCYSTLNIMHRYFNYLPRELDDYIAQPKANSYQSIHTIVLGPHDKIIEIQIRTYQMHKNAELGMAAHGKYKDSRVVLTNYR